MPTTVLDKELLVRRPPTEPAVITRPGSPRAPAQRVVMIERLRIVAMFEIVAFHIFGRLPLLDGLGLPVFLLLSLAFTAASAEGRCLRTIAGSRLLRVGRPWLFWWGVYAALFSLRALRHGESPAGLFRPPMILYGPSEHLWFCPYIILAGLLVALLHRASRGGSHPWRAGVTLLLAYAVLLVVGSQRWIEAHGIRDLPTPFWQWYFSAPSLLLGLAMGQALLLSRDDPRWMDRLAAITVPIAAVSVVLLPVEHIFRRYAVSVALIATVFVAGRHFPAEDRWTRLLSPTMLGVYLSHVVFVNLFYRPLHSHDLLFTAVVFAASAGMVAVLRRGRLHIFL